MSSLRRIVPSLALFAAVMGAACGDPPEKEMQQAQGAIDAARATGADQYARDEFTAAEAALKRAQTAAKDTVNLKATARADAEKALADAAAALDESRAKAKTAESGRASTRALSAARGAMSVGESSLQEARTAFERGDYLIAIEKARNAATRLRVSTHVIEPGAPPAGRRRR